jgi:hypothetical protein
VPESLPEGSFRLEAACRIGPDRFDLLSLQIGGDASAAAAEGLPTWRGARCPAARPRPVIQPHSLALVLWLAMVAVKLLQLRQRLRAQAGRAMGRAFSAELERRRRLERSH